MADPAHQNVVGRVGEGGIPAEVFGNIAIPVSLDEGGTLSIGESWSKPDPTDRRVEIMENHTTVENSAA